MAINRKPVGSTPISINHGKASFIKVVPRGGDSFTNHGNLKVKNDRIDDIDNPAKIHFSAFVVRSKTDPNQILVKLTAVRTRGPDFTDGMLSITLVDTTTTPNIEIPVLEMPVTYIDEPAEP